MFSLPGIEKLNKSMAVWWANTGFVIKKMKHIVF